MKHLTDKEHFEIEFRNSGFQHIGYPYFKLHLSTELEADNKYGVIILNVEPVVEAGNLIFRSPILKKYEWADVYEKIKIIALHEARHTHQFLYELDKANNDVYDAIQNMSKKAGSERDYYELEADRYALHFLKDHTVEFDNNIA